MRTQRAKPQALKQSVPWHHAYPEALFRVISVGRAPSLAIVDTAPLRASTSCPTSRLVDAREAISSSFAVIFSMVVKSHSDAAHITRRARP